jgi:glycosyltransferase involved in cell wall biosynthesis
MPQSKFLVIVLTLNEGKHLARCLESVKALTSDVLVVDSFSTDNTLDIAALYGARVRQHHFINQAKQFNWALTQIEGQPDWILRIDADEYLPPEGVLELRSLLENLSVEVSGVLLNRRIVFQGRKLRYGGLGRNYILRVFRYGKGRSEVRWMDEHIKVEGSTSVSDVEIVDENLNSLSWWIEKHNHYANREAVDSLKIKYRKVELDSVSGFENRSSRRRWLKENMYMKLPRLIKPISYFLYRYLFTAGFLDGRAGFNFHFLRGFWYRYIVDLKITEVESVMKSQNETLDSAVAKCLDIEI